MIGHDGIVADDVAFGSPGRSSEGANAVLAAAGYNFRRTLAWLKLLAAFIKAAIISLIGTHQTVAAA